MDETIEVLKQLSSLAKDISFNFGMVAKALDIEVRGTYINLTAKELKEYPWIHNRYNDGKTSRVTNLDMDYTGIQKEYILKHALETYGREIISQDNNAIVIRCSRAQGQWNGIPNIPTTWLQVFAKKKG